MSIAHFTLATRDVAGSQDFFANTMGWKPISHPGNIITEVAWLRIAPGQELHLLYVPGFEPSEFEREFGRHFAIEYPLEKFDQLKQRLVEQGAELIEPARETPFERFFFRDPNGYVFEVVDTGR
jgi:catechol 2,3-dioxygenase-like lactoylglutathione lyase family enzyme